MLRAWAIAPVVVFLASCATNKSFVNYGQKYPPNSETVKVFPPSEPVDAGCTRIGEIHIYDSGFSTGCGYDSVLEQAKKVASQNGGNAFQITRISEPHFWSSTCYRIRGEALLCKVPPPNTSLEHARR
jgi:hypothetical protein